MTKPARKTEAEPTPEQAILDAAVHALWGRARRWVIGAATAAGLGSAGGIVGLVIGNRAAGAVEQAQQTAVAPQQPIDATPVQTPKPPSDATLARDAEVQRLSATVGSLANTMSELRTDLRELRTDLRQLIWRERAASPAVGP